MLRIALLSLALAGCGAQATVGTVSQVGVPPDAPKTCAGYCQSMGLTLDSVVIMASNVGCVCNARPEAPAPAPTAPTAPAATGAGAAGAMTAIMILQQAAAAASRNHNSSHH
jgi:hypothetical protein